MDTPACWTWELRSVADLLADGRRRRTDDDRLEALYVWQADRCGMCGKLGQGRRGMNGLYHDHDYRTGLLRGMLCPGCNSAEGTSDDLLVRRYRLRHPTMLLGVEVEWAAPWHWLAPYEADGSRAVERRSLGLAAGLPSATLDVYGHAVSDAAQRATAVLPLPQVQLGRGGLPPLGVDSTHDEG